MKFAIIILLSCNFIICCKPKNGNKNVESGHSDSLIINEIPDSAYLIIPGQSAGKIRIGLDAGKLDAILGKPDFSDAAMGKAWMSWYGEKENHGNDTLRTELNIFTTYKDTAMREKTVQQIHITSPKFTTENGIATGKSFEEINNKFTKISLSGEYVSDKIKKAVMVYDAVPQGIAFEIYNDTCIGIIIHAPGKKATDQFRYLHPDMKVF